MQPNGYPSPNIPQPAPQPPSDPYAFLYQPSRNTNPLANMLNSGSKGTRLLVVLGGVVLLIIIGLIFKSVLSSGGALDMNSLYYVIGEQQELINLANTATQDTNNQDYKNLTYTIIGSATTDKDNLINLLAHNGYKVDPKKLVLQRSADLELNQANQNNSFDATYISVIKEQLLLYENELSSAYSKNKSNVIKKYLKTDYANAALLLKMLGSTTG